MLLSARRSATSKTSRGTAGAGRRRRGEEGMLGGRGPAQDVPEEWASRSVRTSFPCASNSPDGQPAVRRRAKPTTKFHGEGLHGPLPRRGDATLPRITPSPLARPRTRESTRIESRENFSWQFFLLSRVSLRDIEDSCRNLVHGRNSMLDSHT